MPEKSPVEKDPRFVSALARGIQVLRCFTPESPELGASEIARLTGLPQPTVWRLCYTLTQLGCLVPGRMPDRLRAGPGLLLLGHAAVAESGIGELALPMLQRLADDFGASVSLGAQHEDGMVVIQRTAARGIANVIVHVGSKLGMTDSSMGCAWLAAVDEDRRAAAMAPIRAIGGPASAEAEKHLAQALADYAAGGFVFSLGRSHPDINAVGVPVVSPRGNRTVMALTCGALQTRMTQARLVDEVAPALKALALEIAPLLGAVPHGLG